MKTIKKILTTQFIWCLSFLMLTVSAAAQNAPPKAEKREVKDVYFGQTISDSYRWLEDMKSDET